MLKLIEVDTKPGYVDVYMVMGEGDSERHIPYLWNAKKYCEHVIVSPGCGGVRCEKCGGWCCF